MHGAIQIIDGCLFERFERAGEQPHAAIRLTERVHRLAAIRVGGDHRRDCGRRRTESSRNANGTLNDGSAPGLEHILAPQPNEQANPRRLDSCTRRSSPCTSGAP